MVVVALEATVRMSDRSSQMGGARGNLLPLLKEELDCILDDEVHEVLNNRKGFVGLAYRELLPNNRPVLDTKFEDRDHVIDSVCNSSTFPFFSSNWPCRFARTRKSEEGSSWLPRIAVDGYFSVDRERFGCPDFDEMDHERDHYKVDRTVTLSVFPHDVIRLTASDDHDQISPTLDPENSSEQISNLFRLATKCAEREEYYKLYEDGWEDAEKWLKEEEEKSGYWGSKNSNQRRQIYAKMLMQNDLN